MFVSSLRIGGGWYWWFIEGLDFGYVYIDFGDDGRFESWEIGELSSYSVILFVCCKGCNWKSGKCNDCLYIYVIWLNFFFSLEWFIVECILFYKDEIYICIGMCCMVILILLEL